MAIPKRWLDLISTPFSTCSIGSGATRKGYKGVQPCKGMQQLATPTVSGYNRLPAPVLDHAQHTGSILYRIAMKSGFDAMLDYVFTTRCQGCDTRRASSLNHVAFKRVKFSDCRASGRKGAVYLGNGLIDLQDGVQALCEPCHTAYTNWQNSGAGWAALIWPDDETPERQVLGPVPE